MRCSGYERLKLKHESAMKWIERYAQPKKYGITIVQGAKLHLLLSIARAKEFDLRVKMEKHRETCEMCRAERGRDEQKVG